MEISVHLHVERKDMECVQDTPDVCHTEVTKAIFLVRDFCACINTVTNRAGAQVTGR